MADKYAQAKVSPDRRSEPVADLGTSGTSTTTQIEQKVNAALEVLRKAGFLKV